MGEMAAMCRFRVPQTSMIFGSSGIRKRLWAKTADMAPNINGSGRNAAHIIILVPLGTRVTDLDSGTVINIERVDKPILIARGGAGGYGNFKFKSATNQAPTN